MNPSQRLAQNLVSESKAYGYTLVIWGAGGILIHQYGSPNVVQVGVYIGGALAATAVLTVAAFGGLFVEREPSTGRLIAASIVHLFATGGNLAVSYVLVISGQRFGLPPTGVFLLIGFQATFLYNLFLLLEHAVAHALK